MLEHNNFTHTHTRTHSLTRFHASSRCVHTNTTLWLLSISAHVFVNFTCAAPSRDDSSKGKIFGSCSSSTSSPYKVQQYLNSFTLSSHTCLLVPHYHAAQTVQHIHTGEPAFLTRVFHTSKNRRKKRPVGEHVDGGLGVGWGLTILSQIVRRSRANDTQHTFARISLKHTSSLSSERLLLHGVRSPAHIRRHTHKHTYKLARAFMGAADAGAHSTHSFQYTHTHTHTHCCRAATGTSLGRHGKGKRIRGRPQLAP